jgi:transcription elongation factor GreB
LSYGGVKKSILWRLTASALLGINRHSVAKQPAKWCQMSGQNQAKTKLITREGYNQLKTEHDELWFKKRPEVTKIVSWAASLGDRSENADYTFNKRLLRQIDSRIRYLRKRLEDLQIVDYSPQQAGKVFFGAWVEVEDEDGNSLKFRIVGPDEIYGRTDYISIDAPMARALLKKQVDDSATVTTPVGTKEWWVTEIYYPQPA